MSSDLVTRVLVGGLVLVAITSTFVVQNGVASGRAGRRPSFGRMRQKLAVSTNAVVLWPAAVLCLLGVEPFLCPVSATICVSVAVCLSLEVTALSAFRGPLYEYENSESVYERGVQVSTVAFAVATMLLSQKNGQLASIVATPVFTALLFCTLSAVPSGTARRRVEAAAHWSAIQKVMVSFAAGLLCLSVARCIDELARHPVRVRVPRSTSRANLFRSAQ